MKLFYSPGACSLASDIVLHELGTPTEFVKVDLKAHKTEKGDDFYGVNPKGYVPALMMEDGDVLTENVAILQYLGSKRASLLPDSGAAKWHGIETLAFVSTEIHKSFKPLFDPSSTDEAKKKAKELLAKRLGTAAEKLGSKPYLLGDDFSVVDAYLFTMLLWSTKMAVDIPAALKPYMERVHARPAVAAALKMEGLAN